MGLLGGLWQRRSCDSPGELVVYVVLTNMIQQAIQYRFNLGIGPLASGGNGVVPRIGGDEDGKDACGEHEYSVIGIAGVDRTV